MNESEIKGEDDKRTHRDDESAKETTHCPYSVDERSAWSAMQSFVALRLLPTDYQFADVANGVTRPGRGRLKRLLTQLVYCSLPFLDVLSRPQNDVKLRRTERLERRPGCEK